MPRRARRLVVAPSYTAPSAMLPASTASAYPDIHEDAATLAHSSVAAAQWLLLVQRPLDGHRQSLASWRTVLDVAHRALIDWPLFGVCATEEQERARSGLTRVGLASELLWRSGVHAMAVAGVGHDARRREAARTQAVSLSQPLSHYYQFLLNKSLRGRARSTLNEHMVLAYAMAGVAMGRGAEAYHRLKDAIGTTRCGQCAVHVGYAGVIAFGMWVEQERLRADRGDGGFGREKRRRVVTSIDSDGDGEEDVDNVDDDDVSSWNTHDPLFREARQYLEESLAMAMDSEMFLVVYCRLLAHAHEPETALEAVQEFCDEQPANPFAARLLQCLLGQRLDAIEKRLAGDGDNDHAPIRDFNDFNDDDVEDAYEETCAQWQDASVKCIREDPLMSVDTHLRPLVTKLVEFGDHERALEVVLESLDFQFGPCAENTIATRDYLWTTAIDLILELHSRNRWMQCTLFDGRVEWIAETHFARSSPSVRMSTEFLRDRVMHVHLHQRLLFRYLRERYPGHAQMTTVPDAWLDESVCAYLTGPNEVVQKVLERHGIDDPLELLFDDDVAMEVDTEAEDDDNSNNDDNVA